MITLSDGRNELWQWDTNRKLNVDADCSQVHFSNKVYGRSIDVDIVNGTVFIPDILLQTDKDLYVWAFVGTPENGHTKISKIFKVNRRNKPADYVFTPVDQLTLEEIKKIAESVREDADKGLFKGEQGEKGEKGDPGYNPIKGKDYVDGKDGYTPVKGVDYTDGLDGIGIVNITSTRPTPDSEGKYGSTLRISTARPDGTDSKQYSFWVQHGRDGAKGDKGDKPNVFSSTYTTTKNTPGGEHFIPSSTVDTTAKDVNVGDLIVTQEGKLYLSHSTSAYGAAQVKCELLADLNGKDGVKTVNGVAPDVNGNVEIEAGGDSVVCVTYDYQTGKCSHNRAQIQELAASGKMVVFKDIANPEYTYYLQDSYAALFAVLDPEEEYFKAYYASVNSDGTANLWRQNLAQDTVRFYVTQILSEEFKARARNNIGAAADSEVIKTVNGQSPDENGNVEIAAGGGSGVEVTAKPGQLIRVKETDENGKPTAWEAVPWGYTERDVLLEETDAVEATDPKYGKVWVITKAPNLTAGETYTVMYNGTSYECVCIDLSTQGVTDGSVALGNLSVSGGENTGEPFAMIANHDKQMVIAVDLTGATSVRIGFMGGEIHHPIPGELLPEGVPYVENGGMVEILAECQPPYDAGEEIFVITGNAPTFVAGKTYIVNWNGTEYTCVGQDMSSMMAGAVGLGDISQATGGTSTGEPFAMFSAVNEGIAIYSIDGTTELTLSIKGKCVNVHPIDPRCLPDGVPYCVDVGMVEIYPETTLTTFEEGGDTVVITTENSVGEMVVGETYIVNWNGTEYECVIYMLGDMVAFGVNMVTGEGNQPFVGLYSAEHGACQFIVFDDSTEVTVSIHYVDKKVGKLDKRCLPDEAVTDVLIVRSNDDMATATSTGEKILEVCRYGRKAGLFSFGDKTLPLRGVGESGIATFETIWYGGDGLHRTYVVVEADGTISDFVNDSGVITL